MAADVTRADLRAAVAAGVLDETQAARLIALATSRSDARVAADDEPFELFRGMADVFMAAAVAILGTGAVIVALVGFGWGSIGPQLAIAALAWGLAEYLTRRRRMVLPSLLLALGVALPAAGAAGAAAFTTLVETADPGSIFSPVGMIETARTVIAVGAAAGAVAALAFYLRFRLPFAVFLTAVGVTGAALAATGSLDALMARRLGLDVVAAPLFPALVAMGCGAAAFAAAMAFDLRDPHRVTRLSAVGFWLHVAAAGLLVNGAASLAVGDAPDLATALGLAPVVLGAAAVALVVDRRSFLVAALAWSFVLLLALVGPNREVEAYGVVLLGLGAFLVTLGVAWGDLRAALLNALPDFPYKNRLPPWEAQ